MRLIIGLLACVVTASGVERTSIGFGSCLNQWEPAPILSTIAAAKPDRFLFLGDNIYCDTTDPTEMQRQYGRLGRHAGFRQLKAATTLLATWDDHDYGENNVGAEFVMKHDAERLFEQFWPTEAEQRQRYPGVYAAHSFGPSGQRVQIILLDTRFFRSLREHGNQPEATILGDTQWTWLKQQLQQPAELRLICSSIQVVADQHRFEKWFNFPNERQKLFDVIRGSRAGGVILLSGDRHTGTLLELRASEQLIGYPLYDLTASGLNQRMFPDAPDSQRVGANVVEHHFGWIDIVWNDDPRISLQLRNVNGGALVAHSIFLSELQPQPKN